jgi:hypothetical protein
MKTDWKVSGHETLQGAIPAFAWEEETEREREEKYPENLSG